MTVILVVVMFAILLLVDHLAHRSPVEVAELRADASGYPRLAPAVVAGFDFRDGLRYHPGHTWALSESPELVRVGMDDFASRLIGRADRMTLPARGQWVRQGQKVFSVMRDGREIEMVSPIEGTVVDVNPLAVEDPDALRRDPYGDGWLLKVNAPDAATNLRNLLTDGVARRWLDEAAARLRAMMPAAAGAVAQDGGVAVDDLKPFLPEGDWERTAREFFLT